MYFFPVDSGLLNGCFRALAWYWRCRLVVGDWKYHSWGGGSIFLGDGNVRGPSLFSTLVLVLNFCS